MKYMSEQSLEWAAGAFGSLRTEMAKVLVGQSELVEALSLALVCNQHVLIEGVPGVAKTLAVRTLSRILGLDFQRIQFTPDLLPSDLIGTQIFHPQKGDFSVRKGPVFAHLVLADEINRSPAKVQSALLEAMEERQVTLGDSSFPLPKPFMVLATQNPIEQEGTYALPEAQLDRFMFKIEVGYPDRREELEVLRLKKGENAELFHVLQREDLEALQKLASKVHLDETIEEYIVDIVRATRHPAEYKLDLGEAIRWGAGPRAVVFFLQACQARAIWKGRDFVMPEDVQALAPWILRHRILLSYEALAEGLDTDKVIARILAGVKAP
jgi:MoxR-like ATPase